MVVVVKGVVLVIVLGEGVVLKEWSSVVGVVVLEVGVGGVACC